MGFIEIEKQYKKMYDETKSKSAKRELTMFRNHVMSLFISNPEVMAKLIVLFMTKNKM